MNDPSKYVQKSVANHINDITKEDKELVFNGCSNYVINSIQLILGL